MRQGTLHTILAIVFFIIVAGCSTVLRGKDLRDALATVNATDGISFEEAMIISDNYYKRYTFSGFGAPGKLIDVGDRWERIVYGRSDRPLDEGILIHKKTGRTSWKYGPTVNNPKEIWIYNASR
ncbi:MAG: hypothetical protein ACM34I_03495 [bacterium]